MMIMFKIIMYVVLFVCVKLIAEAIEDVLGTDENIEMDYSKVTC